MAYKKYYKTFTMENELVRIDATCYTQGTSYGFHHCCTDLEVTLKNDDSIWQSDKPTFCPYYNRTWETYQFQSVLLQTLHKMNIKPETINHEAESLIKHYGGY